jgi:hypothetical protein
MHPLPCPKKRGRVGGVRIWQCELGTEMTCPALSGFHSWTSAAISNPTLICSSPGNILVILVSNKEKEFRYLCISLGNYLVYVSFWFLPESQPLWCDAKPGKIRTTDSWSCLNCKKQFDCVWKSHHHWHQRKALGISGKRVTTYISRHLLLAFVISPIPSTLWCTNGCLFMAWDFIYLCWL